MDDILIPAETLDELRKKTKRVLSVLLQNDLFAKPEKCEFEVEEVEFLGIIIKQGSLKMANDKFNGVINWPTPQNVKQVRQFLGFCNFYRRFIPNFANLAHPLNILTRTRHQWAWTNEQEKAFQNLKDTFAKKPTLLIPDPQKPFFVETDASLVATGAVLYQQNEQAEYQPCSFISNALEPAQQRYEIYDRELLAIVRALRTWRHYLLHSPHIVTIWTDHENITRFKTFKRLTPRQVRWQNLLSMYNLDTKHRPGTQLIGADMLSRRPDHPKAEDPVQNMFPLFKSINRTLVDSIDDKDIQQAQEADEFSRNLIANLRTKAKNSPVKPEWSYSGDLLRFHGKIYIPSNPDLRRKIISLHHDLPQFGHPGTFRTQALIRTQYSWPKMANTIAKYILGCAPCAQMKINTHPTVPPLQPIAAKADALPFQTVTLDFITDLPKSNGYDSLLVAVDHDVTKAIVLMPCQKNIDALGTADLYHDTVFRRFGLPKTFISDRGPQFAAKAFQELCAKLGIKSKLSTAYHPQTDGQTERTNQEIEAYLRIYCSSHPHKWSEHITNLEFAHNIHTHTVTKQSPFNLLLGYNPIALPHTNSFTSIPSVSERLNHLQELRKEAIAAHDIARMHMLRRASQKFTPFTEGQKVWLEATNLRIPGVSSKFLPKRTGPFVVKNKLSNLVYRLELPPQWKIHDVFHASLLTPFHETQEHGPSFTQPPPDVIGGEEEYEIEAILRHKGKGERIQFLVKWLGYPDSENQWLPLRELKRNARELLDEYRARNKL